MTKTETTYALADQLTCDEWDAVSALAPDYAAQVVAGEITFAHALTLLRSAAEDEFLSGC